MPSSTPDDSLLIRCPLCSQRFIVGEELRGLTVECGGCEHRFRINDAVIVRGKKFYPGERKDLELNCFQRVPLVSSPAISGMAVAHYAEAPVATAFEPVAPQRIIAGAVGVVGMALLALLLMFGATRGGSLDGMTTGNRLLMAGFTGVLGIVLLVYANPRARFRALSAGLLLSAALLWLPLFFTVGSVPLSEPEPRAAAPVTTLAGVAAEAQAELRNQIGTAPLVAEIERLARDGSTKSAVGLWLRGLNEQNRLLVRDYILRVTGADPQTHYYTRGGGDFLMVVTGVYQSLDEMATIAAVLGSVEMVDPDLAVVEVRVNNLNLVGAAIEKLTDKHDPMFYDLNKQELDSIDLSRVKQAVQRLADVEPKIYRSDITRKLVSLLGSAGVDFKGDLCRTLAVWSEQPGPAGAAALKEVQDLIARKREVPQEMVSLIVKEKNAAVIPVVDALWLGNPTRWEVLYGDVGPAAEPTLLRRLASSERMARQSAVRLLGRVGGADSLSWLEAAASGANPEMKVLLEQAAASIRTRLGR